MSGAQAPPPPPHNPPDSNLTALRFDRFEVDSVRDCQAAVDGQLLMGFEAGGVADR